MSYIHIIVIQVNFSNTTDYFKAWCWRDHLSSDPTPPMLHKHWLSWVHGGIGQRNRYLSTFFGPCIRITHITHNIEFSKPDKAFSESHRFPDGCAGLGFEPWAELGRAKPSPMWQLGPGLRTWKPKPSRQATAFGLILETPPAGLTVNLSLKY